MIRDALRKGGRNHVDLVILSHPHADHLVALPGGANERVVVLGCNALDCAVDDARIESASLRGEL